MTEHSMEALEDLTGLDEDFHEAAREHGRAMVELVLYSGTANEAAKRIAEAMRGGQGYGALAIFADLFNKVSRAYAESQDWTPAALEACTEAVELALRGKVLVGSSGIILPH